MALTNASSDHFRLAAILEAIGVVSRIQTAKSLGVVRSLRQSNFRDLRGSRAGVLDNLGEVSWQSGLELEDGAPTGSATAPRDAVERTSLFIKCQSTGAVPVLAIKSVQYSELAMRFKLEDSSAPELTRRNAVTIVIVSLPELGISAHHSSCVQPSVVL
jgi:hypothetical protein